MSGIPRRAIDAGAVSPAKLIDALKFPAYFDQRWPSVPPYAALGTNGYADPSGTPPVTNLHVFRGLFPMSMAQYFPTGFPATVLSMVEDGTNGYLKAGSDANADANFELLPGYHVTANNPFASTPGAADSKNKFIRLDCEFDDPNEIFVWFGFREAEAFVDAAQPTNYNNVMACYMKGSTGDTYGHLHLYTIEDGAAAVDTDLAVQLDADERLVMEVRMFGDEPLFYFNGTKYRTAYRVPAGTVLIPFIKVLNTASPPGTGSEFGWHRLTLGSVEDEYESLQF